MGALRTGLHHTYREEDFRIYSYCGHGLTYPDDRDVHNWWKSDTTQRTGEPSSSHNGAWGPWVRHAREHIRQGNGRDERL